MLHLLRNERGIGLVGVMFAISLLAVFALVAASLAVNERRTARYDSIHGRSFLAADSGAEAAVAWLFVQNGRVPYDAGSGEVRANAMDDMLTDNDQGFAFEINAEPDASGSGWRKPGTRPGYSEDIKYQDFYYEIDGEGEAGMDGHARVRMNVSKLTKVGY